MKLADPQKVSTTAVVYKQLNHASQEKIYYVSDLRGFVAELVMSGSASNAFGLRSIEGFAIVIINPIVDLNKDKNLLILRVQAQHQIMLIGKAKYYAVCSGVRKDGKACSLPVDTSHSRFCKFHTKYESKLDRSSISSPDSVSSLHSSPTAAVPTDNAALHSKVATKGPTPSTTSSFTGNKQVLPQKSIVANRNVGTSNSLLSNKFSVALKPVEHFEMPNRLKRQGQHSVSDSDETRGRQGAACSSSTAPEYKLMGNLLVNISNTIRNGNKTSSLSSTDGPPPTSGTASAPPVKGDGATAVTYLVQQHQQKRSAPAKQKQAITNQQMDSVLSNAKRARVEASRPVLPVHVPSLDAEIAALLQKQSSHESEASDEVFNLCQNRLHGLVKKEERFEATAKIHSVRIRAVFCPTCYRTDEHPVDLCRTAKHPIQFISTIKRFFECSKCLDRYNVIGNAKTPDRRCVRCGAFEWRACGPAGSGQGCASMQRVEDRLICTVSGETSRKEWDHLKAAASELGSFLKPC